MNEVMEAVCDLVLDRTRMAVCETCRFGERCECTFRIGDIETFGDLAQWRECAIRAHRAWDRV